MNAAKTSYPRISLFIPKSSRFTSENKTGSWSFARPRYQEKTSPCSAACPCGQDIPRIEMLVAKGRFAAALSSLLMENPLPGVTGRVCFHPCEEACNRSELDEAVSINALERFIADGEAPATQERRPSKGKRIAIIGSGPAGLSAAYFLARLGFDCDVLEAGAKAGGLLRYGIPSYRLPTATLDREIARIESLGVRLKLGQKMDSRILETSSGYDAVFVSGGHGRPRGLGVPGEELASDALELLARAKEDPHGAASSPEGSARTAAVIGGGNTAIDAARSLLRMGVLPTIFYRRRREDMPAIPEETAAALAEGATLVELCSPLSIEREGGELSLRLQGMSSTVPGADGRVGVRPIPGDAREARFSAVYAAVGADASEAWMLPPEASLVARFPHSVIAWRGTSSVPAVYGGDLVNERESVADAIASGKEAAIALDAYMAAGPVAGPEAALAELARCAIGAKGAYSMEIHSGGDRAQRSPEIVEFKGIVTDYFAPSARARAPALPPLRAARSFLESQGGLDARAALAQAERCFNCGICNGCDNCDTFCPEAAVIKHEASREIDADYCKGCGVCVAECPRNAMLMEEPQS